MKFDYKIDPFTVHNQQSQLLLRRNLHHLRDILRTDSFYSKQFQVTDYSCLLLLLDVALKCKYFSDAEHL